MLIWIYPVNTWPPVCFQIRFSLGNLSAFGTDFRRHKPLARLPPIAPQLLGTARSAAQRLLLRLLAMQTQ